MFYAQRPKQRPHLSFQTAPKPAYFSTGPLAPATQFHVYNSPRPRSRLGTPAKPGDKMHVSFEHKNSMPQASTTISRHNKSLGLGLSDGGGKESAGLQANMYRNWLSHNKIKHETVAEKSSTTLLTPATVKNPMLERRRPYLAIGVPNQQISNFISANKQKNNDRLLHFARAPGAAILNSVMWNGHPSSVEPPLGLKGYPSHQRYKPSTPSDFNEQNMSRNYKPFFSKGRGGPTDQVKLGDSPYTERKPYQSSKITIQQAEDAKNIASLVSLEPLRDQIPVRNYTLNSYAESYQGKRPYNEDTYLVQPDLRQNNLRGRLLALAIRENSKVEPSNSELARKKLSLFAVFDGHGGSKCSAFLRDNFVQIFCSLKNAAQRPEEALRQTFAKLEQKFTSVAQRGLEVQRSGSCAAACLIVQGTVHIANVGDSRVLLVNKDHLKQVTRDHKPEDKDQKNRIITHGGKIYKDGYTVGLENFKMFKQARITPGSLNVSRTIGDVEIKMKKYGGLPGVVIAEPEIFIEPSTHTFTHALVASDGLFEGLTNQQIHALYQQVLGARTTRQPEGDFEKLLVKQLISKAGQKSGDNITVVCVSLY